jgi:hypothetical protein
MTIEARERSFRRALSQADMRLCKTPSRHWTRAYYGPGYMIVDDRNTVRMGCTAREYDGTLDDVEGFVGEL